MSAGWHGSSSEMQVFSQSHLYQSASQGSLFPTTAVTDIEGQSVPVQLLAGIGYPLLCNVMKPYHKHDSQLTNQQHLFNQQVNKTTIIVALLLPNDLLTGYIMMNLITFRQLGQPLIRCLLPTKSVSVLYYISACPYQHNTETITLICTLIHKALKKILYKFLYSHIIDFVLPTIQSLSKMHIQYMYST